MVYGPGAVKPVTTLSPLESQLKDTLRGVHRELFGTLPFNDPFTQ